MSATTTTTTTIVSTLEQYVSFLLEKKWVFKALNLMGFFPIKYNNEMTSFRFCYIHCGVNLLKIWPFFVCLIVVNLSEPPFSDNVGVAGKPNIISQSTQNKSNRDITFNNGTNYEKHITKVTPKVTPK